MSHALIIGGTGMLTPVSHWLGERYETVSVLARSPESFDAPPFNPITCDYQNEEQFLDLVDGAINAFGELDLVIGWFHHINPALALGAHVHDHSYRFIHMAGSAAGNPGIDFEARIAPLRQAAHIDYQLVILGFRVEETGSRWLTHEEICAGVLEAEANKSKTHVIGTVTPWEDKPK